MPKKNPLTKTALLNHDLKRMQVAYRQLQAQILGIQLFIEKTNPNFLINWEEYNQEGEKLLNILEEQANDHFLDDVNPPIE